MSRVRSVERALAVLTALADGPQGVTELATRTGLPKSTVARLLETLEGGGAVEQGAADARYRLGPRVLTLGAALPVQRDLVALAHPYLVDLVAGVGEAAGLSMPEGFEVRYVDQVDARHEVRVRDWTGTRAPMHAVSSGQAILAMLPREALAHLLPERLERLTQRTITRREVLRQRLRQVRRDGYAWVREEFAEGITSVAAAVVDESGAAVAAVHVHGPSYRFPGPGTEAAVAGRVAACAARISTRLAAPGAASR